MCTVVTRVTSLIRTLHRLPATCQIDRRIAVNHAYEQASRPDHPGSTKAPESGALTCLWRVLGSNQRRLSRRFYRPLPLTTRATRLDCARQDSERRPVADSSFDVVSKVDRQEVDNAINQAAKEVGQRFDFKNTGASIAWSGENGVEIKAN